MGYAQVPSVMAREEDGRGMMKYKEPAEVP